MRKIALLSLALILALGLYGCGQQNLAAEPTPFETPTAIPPTAARPVDTPTAVPATAPPLETQPENSSVFDGSRAYDDVLYQHALGPRTPGSEAHDQAVRWMQEQLSEAGWNVELQETTYAGQPVRNVVAKRGSGRPWVILGAHYDSRLVADRDADPALQAQPVPGANDGASGVAVLLELARALPQDTAGEVWLVMFDAEDQGQIPGWDWILGSRAFAESLEDAPDSVIIVDMIGDANLNIYQEQNSDPELTRQVWDAAAESGHAGSFIAEPGLSILDDHTPFLEKGLQAIDIIDFDYPFWHTSQDTPDKVSPESLFAVGDTLLYWMAGR